MIVALLILIVLILLFGAAAVKGWVKSALAGVLWFVAFCAVFIWLASFLGEDGAMMLIGGLGVGVPIVLLIAAGVAQAIEARNKSQANREAQRAVDTAAVRRKPKIERLWHHLAPQIERFHPGAQATAREFYSANDVQGLREYCRQQIGR